MRQKLLSLFALIALASATQAQNKENSPSDAGLDWARSLKLEDKYSAEILTQKLTYYQKRFAYLSRRSKALTRKLAQNGIRNKRLVFKVEELRHDSLQLHRVLQDALNDNQQLAKSYEMRIQGMTGELRAIRDSLSELKLVKRDMNTIKHYFDSAILAKREYGLPVYQVIQTLNDAFRKANSPYQLKAGSGQELIITESFTVKKPVFLFIKSTIHIQGEYKITIKPHPFDEGRTLVDCQPSFQRKLGDRFLVDNPYGDPEQAENRFLNFIDKAMYAKGSHASLAYMTDKFDRR